MSVAAAWRRISVRHTQRLNRNDQLASISGSDQYYLVMDVQDDVICVCLANAAIALPRSPEIAIPLPPFDRRGAELSLCEVGYSSRTIVRQRAGWTP